MRHLRGSLNTSISSLALRSSFRSPPRANFRPDFVPTLGPKLFPKRMPKCVRTRKPKKMPMKQIDAPKVCCGGVPRSVLYLDFPAAVQYKRLPTFALWVSPVAFVPLLGKNERSRRRGAELLKVAAALNGASPSARAMRATACLWYPNSAGLRPPLYICLRDVVGSHLGFVSSILRKNFPLLY